VVTINPVVFVLFLYIAANFVGMISGMISGGMFLEGRFFALENSSLAVSFFLQVLVLCIIFLVYINFRSKVLHKLYLGNCWASFLLVVQIFYLVYSLKNGLNIAGDDKTIEGGSIVNYLLIFLQPDILFLLVGVNLRSNRFFLINVFVFLASMALRGWMSGFFIVLFIMLARYYPVRISMRRFFIFLFCSLIFFGILPAIIEAKWAMRSDVDFWEFFSGIGKTFALEKYQVAFEYLLNRFQHVGHVALLFENSDRLNSDLSKGVFQSYWMDGLPQYTISKVFELNTFKLNSYMVELFFGASDRAWNTNPGVAGWLFVLQERSIFFILYSIFVLLLPFYVIKRLAGDAMLMIVSCFSIIYFFHGWFGAYFNIIFYSMVLVFIWRARFSRHRLSKYPAE